MRLKKDSSEQKLRGAYYTPQKLANAMVRLFASENIDTVLEPSCGDGVFLDSLKETGLLDKVSRIEAVEIEAPEAQKVSDRYKDTPKVKVINQDFFDFYKEALGKKTFDLILGNPPYIRYQYLKESQRECQAQILTSHGMKSNKLINAWVAFMVASVQMLSKRGKIAFVIPAEILQVAYAEDLRLYLANHLAKITLITFEQLVFPDIEQEDVYKRQIREGELLALTPADFDFEKRTVSINKSYQRLNGQDLITTPKTEKSNRVITMPQFLAEEIQDYIKMLYGIGPDDRMFTVTKSYLHREMDRGAKEAGIPRIRIHDIRHSAVSLLIDMGFSATAIADRVGHESIDITYNYAHLFPSKQAEMADKLNMERGN